jgi:ribosome-binding ATPase
MSIQAGLVGLPNVGKSILFNALTRSSVPAEDYPFCTIDPHLACTHVPDDRLENLKQFTTPKKFSHW